MYAARMLSYRPDDLTRIIARKQLSGVRMLGKRPLRSMCAALGVSVTTAGNGARLVHGKWRGSSAICKRQMLIRCRLAVDPDGRITRRRQIPSG